MDETYIKVKGQWCYLYRGMDQEGNLIDTRLSQTRDMEATRMFFEQAREVAEQAPKRVVSDGMRSYPRAITEVLGEKVAHNQVSCVANPIEQDHRGIKQRYYSTLGFHNFEAAKRFCRVFDQVRNFFRPRQWMGEQVSLAERRAHFLNQLTELQDLLGLA